MELTLCQNELSRIRQDVENARLRADREQHQLAAAATSRAEAESESGRLATELVQLRGSSQAEQKELAAGRAELAALNERLAAPEGVAARVTAEPAGAGRTDAALPPRDAT